MGRAKSRRKYQHQADARQRELAAAVNAGQYVGPLARRWGVDRATLYGWLEQCIAAGLCPAGAKLHFTPGDYDRMVAVAGRMSAGQSDATIALELQISEGTVRYLARLALHHELLTAETMARRPRAAGTNGGAGQPVLHDDTHEVHWPDGRVTLAPAGLSLLYDMIQINKSSPLRFALVKRAPTPTLKGRP